MAFQPIVDARLRRIHGYEALVRGTNGESAATVIGGVDEESLYGFDQACRVTAIRSAMELGLDRRLTINFFPQAIYHPEACLRLTLEAAAKYGLPLDRITFEFTENQQVLDHGHLRAIIETYHHHGFQTALDDFGAGFAGLSMLANFQPDVLKLDRNLVSHIDESPARQAILAGIQLIADRLGLGLIAEGVERVAELRTLEGMGIRYFQGYLFARPEIGRLFRDDEIPWPYP
jgi:EAL domain-containing protein (putative c-di-GMP-specific phosphodiesterase class I)